MAFKTTTKTLEYPIFGVQFITETTVLVCGGGGAGRHGIPNGLKTFEIAPATQPEKSSGKPSESPEINQLASYEFPKNTTDAPMSLVLSEDRAVVGCSDLDGDIDTRIFEVGSEILESRLASLFGHGNYIKTLKAASTSDGSKDSIVVAVSEPGNLRVSNLKDLGSPLFKQSEDVDIKDVDVFARGTDGFEVCHVTKDQITLISGSSDSLASKKTLKTGIEKSGNAFLRCFYVSERVLVVFGASSSEKRVFARIFEDGKLVASQENLVKGVRSVNSVTCREYPHNKGLYLVALATSDLSVVLFNLNVNSEGQNQYKLVKIQDFPKSHEFAITNLAISPSLKYVVSVSAANSVHVIELPGQEELAQFGSPNFWRVFLFILILVLAMILAHKSMA